MKPFESIKVFYTVEIHNKDGTLVLKRTRKCDSLVANWIRLTFATWTASPNSAPTISVVEMETGTDWTFAIADSRGFIGIAGVGDQTGILVGSGTTPVAITDYKLQTQIAHGTGAGQLSYGVSSIVGTTIVGNTSYWGVTRAFTNNSGGTITVNEICGASHLIYSPTPHHVMLLRDIVGPLTVNATQVLTVTYKVTTSVIPQSQSGIRADNPW